MALTARRSDRHGTFSGNLVERAIIDIGSNTVRLVLYGGARRAPLVLFNEKVAARLGRDIGHTGALADEAIAHAMRGLRRYSVLLRDLGIDNVDVDVVATAAVRDASNGEEFLKQVAALGLMPKLLSGEDEARFSAMGVIGAFPGACGVVADLGGGSLELVEVNDGEVAGSVSLPLGTLRLPDIAGDQPENAPDKIGKNLAGSNWQVDNADTLYLVGGTWRAMGVYAIEQLKHPLTDPHGLVLNPAQAKKIARQVAFSEADAVKNISRISSMRAQKLPLAGSLLLALLKHVKPGRLVFSAWGLREGIVYSKLPAVLQAQDPFLAGISEFAAMRGSPPILATRIAAWTALALPKSQFGSERMRLGATMLALASMQIEPNFRRDLALEWALFKRWIGITPQNRAMLAAAVSGNGNKCSLTPEIAALADEEALEEAYSWGLAIRLCRRLGARSQRTFQVSKLFVEDGSTLVLALEESHADLFGIPNEKDLGLLAQRLGVKGELRIVDNITDIGSAS